MPEPTLVVTVHICSAVCRSQGARRQKDAPKRSLRATPDSAMATPTDSSLAYTGLPEIERVVVSAVPRQGGASKTHSLRHQCASCTARYTILPSASNAMRDGRVMNVQAELDGRLDGLDEWPVGARLVRLSSVPRRA